MKYMLLLVFVGASLHTMEEKQVAQQKKYNRIIEKKAKAKEPVKDQDYLQAMSQLLAQIEQEEEREKRIGDREKDNILFYSLFFD